MAKELTMRQLADQVNSGKLTPVEAVARIKDMVIYPRYLGTDSAGDDVWELKNGRWTWGSDPYGAAYEDQTFDPVRYVEKYGMPVAVTR